MVKELVLQELIMGFAEAEIKEFRLFGLSFWWRGPYREDVVLTSLSVRWRAEVQRSQVGNYRGSVSGTHAKLGHGRAQLRTVALDSGGEKRNQFGIAGRDRSSDTRHLNGPIRHGMRGQEPQRPALSL
jgi:hypothetical protein